LKPFRRGMYHVFVGWTAMVYPHVPRRLKTTTSRMYIKDLKKAVRQIEETGTWK
jgi:hypothetical protein